MWITASVDASSHRAPRRPTQCRRASIPTVRAAERARRRHRKKIARGIQRQRHGLSGRGDKHRLAGAGRGRERGRQSANVATWHPARRFDDGSCNALKEPAGWMPGTAAAAENRAASSVGPMASNNTWRTIASPFEWLSLVGEGDKQTRHGGDHGAEQARCLTEPGIDPPSPTQLALAAPDWTGSTAPSNESRSERARTAAAGNRTSWRRAAAQWSARSAARSRVAVEAGGDRGRARSSFVAAIFRPSGSDGAAADLQAIISSAHGRRRERGGAGAVA